MQGAMQTLEHMKSLDLAINENVYASLITGHARANDLAGAEKLLQEMGDQITPGVLSFTALLCAYAERGDMASINRVGPAASLVPRPRTPPGEKRSGERSRIPWAYYPKRVMTNEIARSVIIT